MSIPASMAETVMRVYVCVYLRVCVRVCACVCVRAQALLHV